ncbi:MAG TPA: hypothetical protein VF233_13045 [Nitrososphaeraceae archaeon]
MIYTENQLRNDISIKKRSKFGSKHTTTTTTTTTLDKDLTKFFELLI